MPLICSFLVFHSFPSSRLESFPWYSLAELHVGLPWCPIPTHFFCTSSFIEWFYLPFRYSVSRFIFSLFFSVGSPRLQSYLDLTHSEKVLVLFCSSLEIPTLFSFSVLYQYPKHVVSATFHFSSLYSMLNSHHLPYILLFYHNTSLECCQDAILQNSIISFSPRFSRPFCWIPFSWLPGNLSFAFP